MKDDDTAENVWEVWLVSNRDQYGWMAPIKVDGYGGRTSVIESAVEALNLKDGEHRLAIRTEEGDLSITTVKVDTRRIITLTDKRA
jgi:hypothetical protein